MGLAEEFGSNAYPGRPQPSGREQLVRVLDMLARRKWIVVLSLVLVAGAAAAYTFTRTPLYQASSIVMLDLAASRSTNAPSAGGSMGEALFATNSRTLSGELFVIQSSRTISERVQERLAEISEDEEAVPRGGVSFSPASSAVNAIRVVATSADPDAAATLANLYAEEYVHLTQDQNRAYMTTSRDFLEEQERARLRELRVAEQRVADYMQRGGVVGLDQSGSSLVGSIAGLEAQRDNAHFEMQQLEASLQVLQNELETISPGVAQRLASSVDRRIALANEKLAELEAQREQIRLYEASSPDATRARNDLAQIEQQIELLQGEIDRLAQAYVDEVQAAGGVTQGEAALTYIAELRRQIIEKQVVLNGLEAKLDVYNQRIGEQEARLSEIPEQSMELARLQRDREHAEQMYQFVVQRLQETRIAEESEPGYAHVLQQAYPARRPVSPDRERHLVLGVFFGLMLGIGLAVLLEQLDNRLHTPQQLRQGGYNVVNVIPDLGGAAGGKGSSERPVEVGGRKVNRHLVALLDPMSAPSEAYRHVRTSIQFSLPDKVVQTILITSPGMGDGKSTTAANLAVTMAGSGRRTLLIDADLRRPVQHRILGLQSSPGLAEALFEAPGSVEHMLQPAADNLWLLSAGGGTDVFEGGGAMLNPAELLGSKRLRDHLQTFRETFDVVIIDSPPVLAATDSILLSTQSDVTLLVTRAGVTKEAALEDSYKELQDVGAHLMGVLLNGFDVSSAYGQKYKYGQYSKYTMYARYGSDARKTASTRA